MDLLVSIDGNSSFLFFEYSDSSNKKHIKDLKIN
jgi:hypothetical protein